MSIARLSLLDRGMVFVLAHIRGGGEMGRPWYEHGKLLHKKNTFTDYVDVRPAPGRHRLDHDAASLVGLGGSAGGLLMGAVANLAPELFGGIVAQVPFVDALTTILDPSLPLTVIEWDEWGDPLHDPEVYAYMKSYTPYENIGPRAYPAIYAHDLDQRHAGASTSSRPSGSPSCATPCPTDAESCSSARCRPGTAAPAGATTPGARQADFYAWIIDTAGAPHTPR